MPGHYIALGDSMSIDEYAGGPGRGAASLLLRNHDADFPEWAGKDLTAAGFTAQFLAADGALSADVVLEQLPEIVEPPTLVTVTMGGNDLMVHHGSTVAAYAAVDRVVAAADELLTRLPRGDGCLVVMTTVYDPSDGTGHVPGSALPPWPEGSVAVRALNAELARVARRHAAVVADVHRAFAGHGVAAGDPEQPDPRPADRNLWYCDLIEPNAWGAHHIRETWWQALR